MMTMDRSEPLALETTERGVHPWHHYVAMGDSFTEGVGDAVEGFARMGVADRLAVALRQANPDLQYTNLARRGLCVDEIRQQQLDAALRLMPDLVSIVAGANDILTGRFSTARWEEQFGILFEALTQTGAAVITANVPEFPILPTLKAPLQARVNGNIARGNSIIERLAAQYRVVLVDAWSISQRTARDDWSEDGVHLNSRGYFVFAREMLKTLEQQTGLRIGNLGAP
jgi:lysophospholipase L1-like esterase